LSVRPLLVDLGRDDRGGQHQALLLLQGLLERGHAPELIAVRDSRLASRAKAAGARVHVVHAGRRLAAAAKIRKLVSERRVDIVHANEPHALSSAWVARAHRFVPVVVSRRIALPLSQSRFSLARYRAAARVIAVSHFVKLSVLDSGLAPDRVSVIYDGVQIQPEVSASQREAARAQLGIAPEIPCIGNIAAFVPEKGHALLLDAFASVRAQFPGCVLVLRGEGRELPKIESRARHLRVAEALKFFPPSTDVETLFAALDIFVFPSHDEPLGSALLAAMARGLPCVANAGGGIPEVVEGGKNGLLVAGKDPEAFAAAVARLLLHPEEASRLGRAARETIVARFSADRMVEETLRLYELLVTGDQ
jgi:glycosyltransferase involved in cell wall biosynthesis